MRIRLLTVLIILGMSVACAPTASEDAGRVADPPPGLDGLDSTTTAPPATAAPSGARPTTTSTAPTTTAAPTTTIAAVTPAAGVLQTPSGVLAPVRGTRDDGSGWVVGTPCGGEAVVAGGMLLAPVQVLIDPGHGGLEEPGSVGPTGLREADVNLEVALLLEQWLLQQGVSVQLTRRTDLRLSLVTRAELAAALPPTVFVSVHHNGGPVGPSPIPGTLVFHQADDWSSRRLAGLVYEELSRALQPLALPWVAGFPPGAMTVRNLEGGDYYGVLRRTPGIPSVIAEAFYITNAPEEAALRDPAVQQLEAEALGRAIMRYLTTLDPGSGFQPQQVFGPGAVPRYEEQECIDPALG